MTRGLAGVIVFAVVAALAAAGPVRPRAAEADSATPSTAYFAEGSTLDGFHEYLLLANPDAQPVQVSVTYNFDDGTAPFADTLVLQGVSRTTVDVNAVVGRGRTGVSIGVTSPRKVIAERSMYFDRALPIGDVNGSHTVAPEPSPSATWDFAEGSTLPGFEEYITLQNAGASDAAAVLTFSVENGGSSNFFLDVPAGQRRTVDVNGLLGAVAGHSTHVSSSQPILAERPMYFRRAVGDDDTVIVGGHSASGVQPATTWSFAEGTVLPGFATYLTLSNPQAQAQDVNVTYYLADGSTQSRTVRVEAASRRTVKVFANADTGDPAGVGRDVPDPDSRGVSMRVTAPLAIVAERPIYFHHRFGSSDVETNDGTDTAGATRFSTSWGFAEGSTKGGFYPFLTILNPSAATATAKISYLLTAGPPVVRTVSVPALARLTVQAFGAAVDGGIGRPDTDFGVLVETSGPTLVEQPLYVETAVAELPEISGGSDTVGQPDAIATTPPPPPPGPCADADPAVGVSCDEVVLGGTTALSGPLGIYGQQGLSSAQAFIGYFNQQVAGQHGLRKLRLIYYDDGYDPQQSLVAAQRLVEQDHVFALLSLTSPDATSDYLAQHQVPLIGDTGIVERAYTNPYIWPTRIDDVQRATLTVGYLRATYGITTLARIDAPTPAVDTTQIDNAWIAACQEFGITKCDVNKVKITTDSSDCSQQMNTISGYQDELVVLPTPATQWLACVTAAQTQQYYNLGPGRQGLNPASMKLVAPGFFGGSGIQAETDQCQSFCVGIKTLGFFIDAFGPGYQTNYLDAPWNGMTLYRQNMQTYAGSIDPTSLVSINQYFAAVTMSELIYRTTIGKGLPLTRTNLASTANSFDFDPGSGAEIHWHDVQMHEPWNCGYIYEIVNASGTLRWEQPPDKTAKLCA